MAHINVNPRTMTIVQARQKRDDLHPTASTGGGQGGAALQEEITMFCEQVEEQTCMSVERPDLINEIQKILNNLRNDPEVYQVEPEGESGVSTPERGPLWPIISLLKTISTLMMGDPQILHQIRSEIDDLGLLCDEIISGRCWELKFHRSQASSLMEKSRVILDEFTKVLFDGLIVRVHNQATNSRQKAAMTKLVDGFKDCCYLELEVKVTDLLPSIEPKETTSTVGNVVVRILGSWEIKEPAGEVMTLPQQIQQLSEQEQSFPPKVEDVLRRLQLQVKEEVREGIYREKMLKDILEKNLLLRKIVELCDESDTFNLSSILERCENWSREYEHKYKPVQWNRNEEFYAERIRLYIQEKLQVDPNMMLSSPLSKAEILFYLLNSDKGADNPVMALLCRIWKPLHSDVIHNVYELTCFLFSDDQIFDHFYHLLDQNWKVLDHVLKKNIKEFILNDQSHFLVEQLLRTTEIVSTSTSASSMHSYPLENLRKLLTETCDPTRLSQATHMFQTPTFGPYIKIFKGDHVEALYSLLAFENSVKQTALHTNANCIAWIIIHTYVPRYRTDIEQLLTKMDPSEGTPVNNRKQGSPNVLIIASESGKADALSRGFKEAGMNVYNGYKYEPLETDKQEMKQIVVHIKRIFEQNDTLLSGLFVVFLAAGVKKGTQKNLLRQIEIAMCESKANEGRCIPKILITDCEAATYRPTHKHFCAILFSGRGSAKNQLDHEPADFLEKFVRLLGAARPGLSLESLFNTASSQMSNEDGSLTPIMLSKLATDYYPLRGGLSASVSSSTQIQDVGLLSWTREQVSKNRYIMHDNPTVLIIYTTHDRPGAEKEASSLSDAFESTNHYKIKIQPDKPVEKILQFIEESATETDKYSNMQPSALIVIIMSRGNFSHGELEDCDRNSFNVNSVMEAMCQENLTDRPKILITQFTQTKDEVVEDEDEEEPDNHLETPPESFVTLARFTGENASQKSFINELAKQIRWSSRGPKDLNKIIVNASKNQKRAAAIIQNLKGDFIPGIRIPLH